MNPREKEDSSKNSDPLAFRSDACWYIKNSDSKSNKKNKQWPCKRWGHTSEVVNNKLYLYGGRGTNSNSRNWESVYKLDLDTWEWTKIESANQGPEATDSHCCVNYQNKFYFFGGSNQNDSKNDMYEYDLNTNLWKKLDVKGQIPSPREGHSACLFDEKYIMIYGGWNGEDAFDDCFIFDIPQKTWTKVEKKVGTSPSARESQSCCMLKGHMYLFGGQGNNIVGDGKNFDNFYNDLHRFKIIFENGVATAVWEKIEPEGPKPSRRSSHSACCYKQRYMFIIGGEGYPPEYEEDSESLEANQSLAKSDDEEEEYPCFPKNDVFYYDVEINTWFKLSINNDADFVARFAHTANIFRDTIIVFGGLKDYHHSVNDISLLSLDGSDPLSPNNVQKAIALSSENSEVDRLRNSKVRNSKPTISNPPSSTNTGTIEVSKTVFESKYPPKNDNPSVSISFLYSLSKMISWPFAAFGLFLDNSLITKSKNVKINYSTKKRAKKTKKEDEEDDDQSTFSYLTIEDDGEGWRSQQFIRILTKYDTDAPDPYQEVDANEQEEKRNKTNEYAFQMKIAGFRLGRTIIFISKNDDEFSVGLVSADKRFNPNVHASHVFYFSFNSNGFTTQHAEKNKSIILNALNGLFSEDDLTKCLTKNGNKIIIMDLNSISNSSGFSKTEELELIFKKKSGDSNSDITLRTLDKSVKPLYNLNIIELSLRTYLSYFFLDPAKAGLEVLLNDVKIEFVPVKASTQSKLSTFDNLKLDEENLFEGFALKTIVKKEEETKEASSTRSKSRKLSSEKEDFDNQGILLFYNNRLIRRFENPKLGNLDFLSGKMLNLSKDDYNGSIFDLNGYVDLKPYFKPNVFKTEIENPYYSNYLYSNLYGKLFSNDVFLKRKAEGTSEDSQSGSKKVKGNNI